MLSVNEIEVGHEKKVNKFNIWLYNLRKNWKLSVCTSVPNIISIAFVFPRINSFFISWSIITVPLVIGVLAFAESMKLDDSLKNESEKEMFKNRIKDLDKERSRLQSCHEEVGEYLAGLPEAFMKSVSKFLDLKNSDRISLYVLNDKKFQIIGRYSKNPKFKEIRRKEYPSDCGYIAKCLNNNNGNPYFVKEGLPSNLDKYVARVSKETGMSADVIKALSMKSRSYFTRVITDGRDKNVGVLVIESTNKELPIRPEELNDKLEELSIPHMSELLDVSNKLKRGGSDESKAKKCN